MNLSGYILEQALRRMGLNEESIAQFRIAQSLSDVGGKGFPRELFQLNAPMFIRGLLNFGILQMRRDWIYPWWVHKQLDPSGESFIPRGQNPLMLNLTHRNWTAIGTPHGTHEAIVDPRGLLTPLPRTWSVDTWVELDGSLYAPSLMGEAAQHPDPSMPSVTTEFDLPSAMLSVESFVSATNRGFDVAFTRILLRNTGNAKRAGRIFVAVRPFDTEGVSPIHHVAFDGPRIITVNRAIGVVFAEAPDWTGCSSHREGDLGWKLLSDPTGTCATAGERSAECPLGLAHAVAGFRFDLESGHEKVVQYSVALEQDKQLLASKAKATWRVAFGRRKEMQAAAWEKEISRGASLEIHDAQLAKIFEQSRLALLQFHDGPEITPGPYIYHRFWYRDAVLMSRALDVLGFHQRARTIIDAFPGRQSTDGFFKAPDGEWDSNGAVLWYIYQHDRLTRSPGFLQSQYPGLLKAARWILKTAAQAKNGLLPEGISAEHLGTVDQYYYDTIWSIAGLRGFLSIAESIDKSADTRSIHLGLLELEQNLRISLARDAIRLGTPLVPATPSRPFDESAIGSISAIHPLDLHDLSPAAFRNTLSALMAFVVPGRGFFHPVIHSGFNPYLTMQIAHGWLQLGDTDKAWEVAEAVFRSMTPTCALPEAIHPRTGGGCMGDGHHGWAAAEIVMFLRDCIIKERGDTLTFFEGACGRMIQSGRDARFGMLPSDFGPVSVSIRYAAKRQAVVDIDPAFHHGHDPDKVVLHLPFSIDRIRVTPADVSHHVMLHAKGSVVECSPSARTLVMDFQ